MHHRATMKGPTEGNQAAATRVVTREFDGSFDGLGSRVGEEHAIVGSVIRAAGRDFPHLQRSLDLDPASWAVPAPAALDPAEGSAGGAAAVE